MVWPRTTALVPPTWCMPVVLEPVTPGTGALSSLSAFGLLSSSHALSAVAKPTQATTGAKMAAAWGLTRLNATVVPTAEPSSATLSASARSRRCDWKKSGDHAKLNTHCAAYQPSATACECAEVSGAGGEDACG